MLLLEFAFRVQSSFLADVGITMFVFPNRGALLGLSPSPFSRPFSHPFRCSVVYRFFPRLAIPPATLIKRRNLYVLNAITRSAVTL